jgi:hypothetical protein
MAAAGLHCVHPLLLLTRKYLVAQARYLVLNPSLPLDMLDKYLLAQARYLRVPLLKLQQQLLFT